jgi:outer membrane protein TolC
MTRPALVARTSLVVLLSATPSLAQGPAGAPPTNVSPASAAPQPAPLSPPPSEADAGRHAPVGRVTRELEIKLETMMRGGGLTADEVARRAVGSSSQITAKRRSIESAQAAVDQAKASFYPGLTLSARYSRLSDIDTPSLGTVVVSQNPSPHQVDLATPEPLFALPLSFPAVLNQYVLQAELKVPLSDYVLRTSRAISGAARVKAASELEERATRLSVARDARVAYYQWIRAQGLAFVGAQSVEQAMGHLSDATNAFQAGLVSKADVLRARSGVKSAELFQQRAQSAVQLATTRLRVMMKDGPDAAYEVGENILAPVAPLPGTASEAAALREAAQQRVELRVLTENELAIRDQSALTRAANYPRLDAAASAQYANPNQRYFPQEEKFRGTWDASLVLSWAPSAIFGTAAAARSLDAKAAELNAQRQSLLDGLELEVAQALRSERDALFGVQVSQQALAAADEGYRVRRELFRSGRATLVEVTDSETELTRARLELR